jgi:hypothetical protein
MTATTATTLYNPHLLSRAELAACFLARHELLAELAAGLRRGGAQHHLLIGERGAGKTMLLLRLAAAIDDDGKLRKHCIALRFAEEQYNVAHLADLWCNALAALADAYAERGDAEAAARVTEKLAAVADLEPDARARAALAALVAHGKPAHRMLVLLVDNFDLVLARVRDARWALREALSADNGLVLVGASATLVDDVTAYESPFYDFFRVHHLDALSEADARRVAGVAAANAGRFQALYVITGGAPRTLALAREVLGGAAGTDPDPARDLDRLLDRVTPTYKARLDALPAQSQIVVDAVALHWHPISAAECARRAHLDINTASAQLHRLVKSGVLGKVGQPDGPKLGFQLADRLFGLWYLMRAGRRHREQVAAVFELARIAYGSGDRRARLGAWRDAHAGAAPGQPLHELVAALAAPDRLPRLAPEVRAVANDVIAALAP